MSSSYLALRVGHGEAEAPGRLVCRGSAAHSDTQQGGLWLATWPPLLRMHWCAGLYTDNMVSRQVPLNHDFSLSFMRYANAQHVLNL
jgi:hypothetical protein